MKKTACAYMKPFLSYSDSLSGHNKKTPCIYMFEVDFFKKKSFYKCLYFSFLIHINVFLNRLLPC